MPAAERSQRVSRLPLCWQAIADCREKAGALPDRTDEVTRMLDGLAQQHQDMLETVQVNGPRRHRQ